MKFKMNFWLDEIFSEVFSSTGFIPDGHLVLYTRIQKYFLSKDFLFLLLPIATRSHLDYVSPWDPRW